MLCVSWRCWSVNGALATKGVLLVKWPRANLVLTYSAHHDHFVARMQAIKGALVGQAACGASPVSTSSIAMTSLLALPSSSFPQSHPFRRLCLDSPLFMEALQ